MQDYEDMLVDVMGYIQIEQDIEELEYELRYMSDVYSEEELSDMLKRLIRLKACV